MPAGLPIAAAVGGPLRYACYILDWYIVNPSLSCPKKCHRLHLPPVQAETVVTQGVPDTSELEARTAVSAYCFQRDPLFCWPAWEGLEARSGGLQQAPSYDRNQFDRGQRLLCLPCSLDFNRTASFAILQEARKEAERAPHAEAHQFDFPAHFFNMFPSQCFLAGGAQGGGARGGGEGAPGQGGGPPGAGGQLCHSSFRADISCTVWELKRRTWSGRQPAWSRCAPVSFVVQSHSAICCVGAGRVPGQGGGPPGAGGVLIVWPRACISVHSSTQHGETTA